MESLTLTIVRDPSAVVELFSALLVALYMLQLVLKNAGISPQFPTYHLPGFHRRLFVELSDRGAIFPRERDEQVLRFQLQEQELKNFSVGTHLSAPAPDRRRSRLQRCHGQRIRLPQ